MLMDIQINTNDITFIWNGFNDTLKDFVTETAKNIVQLPSIKYNEKKKLFEEAKSWLLREWKYKLSDKSHR